MRQIAAILILLVLQSCVQEASDDNSNTEVTEKPLIELVRSVTELDEDARIAAIAEVERTAEGNFGVNRGVLRHEPVLIDPSDIIVGDLSHPGAVAKEFQISIFGDVSFAVTQTEFDPLNTNGFARLKGVLNGGVDGKISISIHSGDTWPPSLVIRIEAPPNIYVLLPTNDMPYVYIASEADIDYLRSEMMPH